MRKLKLKELNRVSVEEYQESLKIPLVVVLDNIRSALNVGSIFRTCDAFACERIILTGICSVPPHREIHKSAIGATESVDWTYYEEVTEAVKNLRAEGYKIFAIEQTDESIDLRQAEITGKVAVIFGNEVKGVSKEVLPYVDQAIEIEQYGTKHSLNVSVCAGITLWKFSEILR